MFDSTIATSLVLNELGKCQRCSEPLGQCAIERLGSNGTSKIRYKAKAQGSRAFKADPTLSSLQEFLALVTVQTSLTMGMRPLTVANDCVKLSFIDVGLGCDQCAAEEMYRVVHFAVGTANSRRVAMGDGVPRMAGSS